MSKLTLFINVLFGLEQPM